MESSIDFALEGVQDIQDEHLQCVKDSISSKYHSKMSTFEVQKLCEFLQVLDISEASIGTIKSNIQANIERIRLEEEQEKEAKRKEEQAKGGKKKNRKAPGGKNKGGKGGKKKEETKDKINEDDALGAMNIYVGRKKEGVDNSRDIVIDGINIAFGNVFLLDNAKLTLNWGTRYGLIGKNGCGKSMLMKMLANRELHIPEHMLVHLCDSEVEPCEMTALECVLSADKERTKLYQVLEEESTKEKPNLHLLEYVNHRIIEIDADTAEARCGEILAGLGFDKSMQTKMVKDYSGGWRMRIALAQALMLKPDVLLLDEPTNHLDLESCLWLEDHLSKWNKIILIVSHAQDFLNNVCNKIIHFHKGKLNYYGGNYDQFVQTRDEILVQTLKQFEVQEMDISKMKAFVAKFGAGSRATQAKSKIKAMEKRSKNGILEKPTAEKKASFRFNPPNKHFGALCQFRDASFYYKPGEYLYKNLDFGIGIDSRIALVGPNGVGKSTLLKMIASDLEPTEGAISRSPHVRIGRFHQHFMDQLDMDQTPLEFMISMWKDEPLENLRASLGKFGLKGYQQLTPMKKLSGGLKSRVVFCYIARQNPDLLLLDEPTNHLDMETIDTLSEAINEFEGAVLVVSHDTRLIKNISNEIYLVKDKTVVRYEGTIMDYRSQIIEEKELDLIE